MRVIFFIVDFLIIAGIAVWSYAVYQAGKREEVKKDEDTSK